MQMKVSFATKFRYNIDILCELGAILTGRSPLSCFWPPLHWLRHCILNLPVADENFFCRYSVIKFIDFCEGVTLFTMESISKHSYLIKGSFFGFLCWNIGLNFCDFWHWKVFEKSLKSLKFVGPWAAGPKMKTFTFVAGKCPVFKRNQPSEILLCGQIYSPLLWQWVVLV